MRIESFDFISLFICIAAILLCVGVIPFTAVAVGLILLATQFELKMVF
jgi:uncharacterized membrane protein